MSAAILGIFGGALLFGLFAAFATRGHGAEAARCDGEPGHGCGGCALFGAAGCRTEYDHDDVRNDSAARAARSWS